MNFILKIFSLLKDRDVALGQNSKFRVDLFLWSAAFGAQEYFELLDLLFILEGIDLEGCL